MPGKDGFNGQAEELAGPEGEFEAGVVVAPLHVADGLVVDAEGIGEFLPTELALGAEDADAVVERVCRIDLLTCNRSDPNV